jgi:hypothetical protein
MAAAAFTARARSLHAAGVTIGRVAIISTSKITLASDGFEIPAQVCVLCRQNAEAVIIFIETTCRVAH